MEKEMFMQVDRSKVFSPATVTSDTISELIALSKRKGVTITENHISKEIDEQNPSFSTASTKFPSIESVQAYLLELEDLSYFAMIGNLFWGSSQPKDTNLNTLLSNDYKEFNVTKTNWYSRSRVIRFAFDLKIFTRLAVGIVRAAYNFSDLKDMKQMPNHTLELIWQSDVNRKPVYDYYITSPEDYPVIVEIIENILHVSDKERTEEKKFEDQIECVLKQTNQVFEQANSSDNFELKDDVAAYHSLKESDDWDGIDSFESHDQATPVNNNYNYNYNNYNNYNGYNEGDAEYGYGAPATPEEKYHTAKEISFLSRRSREKIQIQDKIYGLEKSIVIQYSSLKFEKKIGVGGFGEVFLGVWNGIPVAIKKVIFEDDEHKIEFLSEMFLMSKLRHPNICQFLGVTTHPEICIVTRYYEKGSLNDLMKKNKQQKVTLPLEIKLRLALDIARGMCYLHSKNIAHRDLKPANILIDNGMEAHISDFGLSKEYEIGMPLLSRCGTVYWMAPEVKNGDAYTEFVDVYSYGILLWELFSNNRISDIKHLIDLQSPYNRPPDFECHHRIKELITLCWDHYPAARPTFIDIIDHLKETSLQLIPLINNQINVKEESIPSTDKTLTLKAAIQSNDFDIIYGAWIECDAKCKFDNTIAPSDSKYDEWVEYSSTLLPYLVDLLKSQPNNAKEMINKFLSIGYIDVELERKRLIHYCVIHNATDCLHSILSNKQIDLPIYSVDKSNHSRSALHHAVQERYLECVKVLLYHGAPVDQCDDCGFASLHIAVANADIYCVQVLLQAGASPNLPRPNSNLELKNLLCFAASNVTSADHTNDPYFFITMILLKFGSQIPLISDLSSLPMIINAAKHLLENDSSLSVPLRSYLNFALTLDPTYSPPSIASLLSSYKEAKHANVNNNNNDTSNNNNNVSPSSISLLRTALYENLGEVKSSIITLKVYPGKYLGLKPSGNSFTLSIEAVLPDDSETWLFEPSPIPNFVKIRSLFNDCYLVAEDKSALSVTDNADQESAMWKLISTGEVDEYCIKSTFGSFISTKGNVLSLSSLSPKQSEKFFVSVLGKEFFLNFQ